MVVDYDGRVLAQADPGPGEKVVVAPIDLAALRQERKRRRGHDMRAHTRTEAYSYLQSPQLARANQDEINIDQINARIQDSKNRLLKD